MTTGLHVLEVLVTAEDTPDKIMARVRELGRMADGIEDLAKTCRDHQVVSLIETYANELRETRNRWLAKHRGSIPSMRAAKAK